MVKVCDAIMGSGKSQSAIAYMNEHRDQPFVYITPYLDEAARIRNGCQELMFVEPSDKLAEFNFSKLEHTKALLREGRNITTTHAAFRSYTGDMVESIRQHNYTLIIDEAVDVFQEAKYNDGDIQLLLDGGYIQHNGDAFICLDREYTGDRLKDLFSMLRCNNLMQVDLGARGTQYYYWAVPCDIMQAFGEVFVLTYLFESQEFKYFLDINGIRYEYIGIHYEDGKYRFTDKPDYIPPYVRTLRDRIHIFDNEKLNKVGNNRCALSANWLKTHKDERELLKKHLYNYIRNYNQCGCDEVMWSTFNGSVNALRGRGFSKQNVVFNMKATNEYRGRTVLAYCVNIFASPQKVQFFERHGIKYDEDGYALSTMIQWIWRSAIRDGKEVDLYIPSRRMRSLLMAWIEEVSVRGEV